MASSIPPNVPPQPQGTKTLADTSAMGTTQGAPVMAISKGPIPGSGPPPSMPGNDQARRHKRRPPDKRQSASRPDLSSAPHMNTPSVGTHPSKSVNKRSNPPHGMTAYASKEQS